MGLSSFGITTGHEHYSALRVRYLNGISWLRQSIGKSTDVDSGVPMVTNNTAQLIRDSDSLITVYKRSIIDSLVQGKLANFPLGSRREHFVEFDNQGLYPVTNEGEGIAYSLGIYSLVEPWGDMLSPPYRDLNREISRFAGKYNSPDYNPLTDYEKLVLLLVTKVKEIIEAREEKIKKELKNKKEEEKPHPEVLEIGKSMDKSEAARLARDEKSKEQRLLRENAKIQAHLPQIAFGQILENADIGYLLLILTSNDIGLTHANDSVRQGTVNIITSITKAILNNVDNKISDSASIFERANIEQNSKYIEEALSLLQCVSRALNTKHFGVNDKNKIVSTKAKELDDFVIDTGIKFKALKQTLLAGYN